MISWLQDTASTSTSLTPDQWLMRLVVAAVYGACVSAIYRLTHGRAKSDSLALSTTLVLLSLLIAMVSLVIGESIARAFSLVGALSIVRFRTVVEDTRDTAFVIFAVVVGMAAGAGLLLLPLVGIPLVGAVALWLSRPTHATDTSTATNSTLALRLGLGREPAEVFSGAFARHLTSCRLVAISTARQGSALDLNYKVRLRSHADASTLVGELNQIEGVQAVELQMS